ncbi:MBL fold metallo-hydrolase [Pseudonocardia hydrocarbonoxydans]|uniref:MBL fold metallo-hydrolase n=1 Tax=Pseudonocardia hydrocarbonoxydans TaxID=76726 RepID=A0A4Y3WII4_9PSEU|nr:MBL fold metallo-hydrolase [Pseudonocardia hydrocarbonoxydans]GEC18762.1 MBL fold metallo-hydrolase [Pseudonocardia hydrocarbonoxydans]
MRLVVLGCSGSGPGPYSPASGYLVEAGDLRVVLDLGNGTLGALQRHLDPWLLDAVAFSHLHPDHCADFTALVVHRRYHPFPPAQVRRLPVYAPAEAPDRFAAAYAPDAAERAETDLSDAFDFRPHTAVTAIGDLVLRTAPVDHPCDAYALRVEHAGRSLVYSGDTGPTDALVELARGADVLLCEATWPHVTPVWDEPPPGVHLSGRQAGEHAAAAGVGRLLLTHVPPWFDAAELAAEAKAAFGGPVEVVTADAGYEV